MGGGTLDDARSLERALADLVEKSKRLPTDHPDRITLERMIRRLRAELAERRSADRKSAG